MHEAGAPGSLLTEAAENFENGIPVGTPRNWPPGRERREQTKEQAPYGACFA
jgi:hypothetical protein